MRALLLIFLAVALATPVPANAAIWCDGVPTSVLVSQDGFLQANWGYTNTKLCNVDADTTPPAPLSPIGARTCQSLYAMLLTAVATGKMFRALLPTETTCSAFGGNGNWSSKTITTYDIER
jgi:hypothetical protein